MTSKFSSFLSFPWFYDSIQYLMGANRHRRDFVDQYVCPSRDDKVLDIGCGTADVLAFLPSTVEYFGFDMSGEYIENARSRFKSRKAEFRQALVSEFSLNSLPKMDIVLACGVIHHLDDDEARSLLNTAKLALAEGGKFIAIDPCFETGQSKVAEWIISKDRGEHVRTEQSYRDLAAQSFQDVAGSVVHRAWIPYTHHIMVCK